MLGLCQRLWLAVHLRAWASLSKPQCHPDSVCRESGSECLSSGTSGGMISHMISNIPKSFMIPIMISQNNGIIVQNAVLWCHSFTISQIYNHIFTKRGYEIKELWRDIWNPYHAHQINIIYCIQWLHIWYHEFVITCTRDVKIVANDIINLWNHDISIMISENWFQKCLMSC